MDSWHGMTKLDIVYDRKIKAPVCCEFLKNAENLQSRSSSHNVVLFGENGRNIVLSSFFVLRFEQAALQACRSALVRFVINSTVPSTL